MLQQNIKNPQIQCIVLSWVLTCLPSLARQPLGGVGLWGAGCSPWRAGAWPPGGRRSAGDLAGGRVATADNWPLARSSTRSRGGCRAGPRPSGSAAWPARPEAAGRAETARSRFSLCVASVGAEKRRVAAGFRSPGVGLDCIAPSACI